MTLDTELRAIALELIADFGKAVTVRAKAGEAYDPTTRIAVATPTDVSAQISPPEPFREALVDGDTVQLGDARCFLAASGLAYTPDTTMVVTIDSDEWTIVAVKTLYSGELPAVYELHMRK